MKHPPKEGSFVHSLTYTYHVIIFKCTFSVGAVANSYCAQVSSTRPGKSTFWTSTFLLFIVKNVFLKLFAVFKYIGSFLPLQCILLFKLLNIT